jgi:hypothetical protein
MIQVKAMNLLIGQIVAGGAPEVQRSILNLLIHHLPARHYASVLRSVVMLVCNGDDTLAAARLSRDLVDSLAYITKQSRHNAPPDARPSSTYPVAAAPPAVLHLHRRPAPRHRSAGGPAASFANRRPAPNTGGFEKGEWVMSRRCAYRLMASCNVVESIKCDQLVTPVKEI